MTASDSSAVGIAQLAHAAGESILCREGWRCRFVQITLGFLVKSMLADRQTEMLIAILSTPTGRRQNN